jgi:hypothetical protein
MEPLVEVEFKEVVGPGLNEFTMLVDINLSDQRLAFLLSQVVDCNVIRGHGSFGTRFAPTSLPNSSLNAKNEVFTVRFHKQGGLLSDCGLNEQITQFGLQSRV